MTSWMKLVGLAALVLGGVGVVLGESSTGNPDEAAIRKLDAEWSTALQNKDVDKLVSLYAEDGVLLPSNAPQASGKAQIRDFFSLVLTTPGLSANFAPAKIEVAKAKDMAYQVGTYELKLHDPQGNPMTIIGKYVVVFKKQPDNQWKAVADIYNPDK